MRPELTRGGLEHRAAWRTEARLIGFHAGHNLVHIGDRRGTKPESIGCAGGALLCRHFECLGARYRRKAQRRCENDADRTAIDTHKRPPVSVPDAHAIPGIDSIGVLSREICIKSPASRYPRPEKRATAAK